MPPSRRSSRPSGPDGVGQLTSSRGSDGNVNATLDALEGSLQSQRNLVADVSLRVAHADRVDPSEPAAIARREPAL